MLNLLFNSSITFGWTISIVGTLIILGTPIALWLRTQRGSAQSIVTEGEKMVGILRSLKAAIDDGSYPEARMMAWLQHRRDDSRKPEWTPSELSVFTGQIFEVTEAMDRRGWNFTIANRFIPAVQSASVADISLLKP